MTLYANGPGREGSQRRTTSQQARNQRNGDLCDCPDNDPNCFDCFGGDVCVGGQCLQPCNADRDCFDGTCIEGLCQAGGACVGN